MTFLVRNNLTIKSTKHVRDYQGGSVLVYIVIIKGKVFVFSFGDVEKAEDDYVRQLWSWEKKLIQ